MGIFLYDQHALFNLISVTWFRSSFEFLWTESHDDGDSDPDSQVNTAFKSIRL